RNVTGVQTCALPIYLRGRAWNRTEGLELGFSRLSGCLKPLSLSAFARGIRGAAQLLVFVRQEGMRLAGICLNRRGLFQVGQGLGESVVQKKHAPQKQVCAVM